MSVKVEKVKKSENEEFLSQSTPHIGQRPGLFPHNDRQLLGAGVVTAGDPVEKVAIVVVGGWLGSIPEQTTIFRRFFSLHTFFL